MAATDGGSYWGLNPLRWWNRISPQCPLTQTCPLIVSFPPEIRIWICSYLNERDRRSMKRVCKHFEFDLNYIYGVDAVLCGPKFKSQLSCAEKAQIALFGNAAETKRIEENANWIRSILPQNLVLRRFSGLSMDTRNLVIVPDFVRSLIVELDERQQALALERFKEVLAYYKNLKRLSVSCRAVELSKRGYHPQFMAFVITVAENLFNSLELKPQVTELSFITHELRFSFPAPAFMDYDTHFAEMVNPATEQWLQNPPKLSRMKIELPNLPIDHLRRWKKFLDAQDRLIHLKLNFGSLQWNFFRTVLRKNASSLKTLDLVLINWCRDQNLGNMLQIEWFNWNLILPEANKLKSLRIRSSKKPRRLYRMLTRHKRACPNPTLNFHLLVSLTLLRKLALVGIYLNQVELRIIFTELQSLKKVKLTAWTRTGEADLENPPDFFRLWGIFGKEDYTERNQNLCDLLSEVLLQKQMLSIKLADVSLWVCLEVNRQNILKKLAQSVYSITWPEPPWYCYPKHFQQYPLTLKVN